MDTLYEDEIGEGSGFYTDERGERTSDIQLPPMMITLMLALWIVISLIGFIVIVLAEEPVVGTVIIAVPTFIGMVIKPTFALCILMLVLPTGAGFAYRQIISLDRGVGLAVAVSFVLNLLITRPRLRIGNKVLWVMILYTIWVILSSLTGLYLRLELRQAFTQFQLLALILIVYWILETNSPKTFLLALRSFVLGSLGTIAGTFITGAAISTIQEESQARYAATLGGAIDANMLAALTATAFLASVYLFARDKNTIWRIVYLGAILFLPTMLIRIGSRGAMIAMGFTLLSPLVFIRQVSRRPALAVLLIVTIILASVSVGLLVKGQGVERPVIQRLTDVAYARQSISYRMQPIKLAIKSAIVRPTGAGYYSWFQRTGSPIWPHNDFFLALGIYGIPGGLLFALILLVMIYTVKRTPLGIEKLFVRAELTFLIIMGLNIGQIYHKYFWVFLGFIIAGERVAKLYLESSNLPPVVEPEESLLQYELV